jgi:hypothetical protein
MPNVDLKQIVPLLESTDPMLGLAYENAWDTHRLWMPSDRERLSELAELLSSRSPSVMAYALKCIRRIGGDLDAYLEAICDCIQPTKQRGFCDEATASGINSEVAAIVRASILGGSSVARSCGAQLIERRVVSWTDRLRIWWVLRRQAI